MKVIRRRRKSLPVTILAALLVASLCFWLGLCATRYLAGYDPGGSLSPEEWAEGTGE
ncbi:MAG: hypothetical protein JW797_17280 [Bradymonadales bacterium]|nr:hypothetical protein [Bradymonadales bacterium]